MQGPDLCPGPGHYKVDRYWPENAVGECDARKTTHTLSAPHFSIPTDSRITPDGIVKGLARPRWNVLGPGQYTDHKLGTLSSEKQFTTFTFPKSAETAEALRDRKKTSDNPGPGKYTLARYGDDLGQEKMQMTDRAYKKGTGCWASSQYAHIFSRMKPVKPRLSGSASDPSLSRSLKAGGASALASGSGSGSGSATAGGGGGGPGSGGGAGATATTTSAGQSEKASA